MNNLFKCYMRRNLDLAYIESSLDLDPRNYLYCDSEGELEDVITDELCTCADYGDVEWQDASSEFNIPKEFYNQWRQLKDAE